MKLTIHCLLALTSRMILNIRSSLTYWIQNLNTMESVRLSGLTHRRGLMYQKAGILNVASVGTSIFTITESLWK